MSCCTWLFGVERQLLFNWRSLNRISRWIVPLQRLINFLCEIVDFSILITMRQQYCLLAKARSLIDNVCLGFAIYDENLILWFKTSLQRFFFIVRLLTLILVFIFFCFVLSDFISAQLIKIEASLSNISPIPIHLVLLKSFITTFNLACLSIFQVCS